MNILITQETDWIERGPHQQHHLAELLSLRGHEVRIIDYEFLWKSQGLKEIYSSTKTFKNVARFYSGANVSLIRPGIIKAPIFDYLSLVFSHRREIEKQIREFAPDVIIGFGIINSYLSAQLVRKTKIPFIYYWIDVLHQLIPFKPLQPIGRLVEKMALKRSDAVITINDKLKEYVIKEGARPDGTKVIRGGIDLKRFNPANHTSETRKQYGFKEQDCVLFYMGWLYLFSGLKEVAVQLAQAPNHNIKLVIVGEGDAYDELKALQVKYNLEDSLILMGKKPYNEIPSLISVSDICLLPAYNNRIMRNIVPIKMYEYMAMQKPVISTKLPGIMGEFGEGNGVIYVSKPGDAVKKAIEISSSGNTAKLGLKAREFARRCSWDEITDEFEAILERAKKRKHKSGNI